MPLIQKSVTGYRAGGRQKDEYRPDDVVSVACPLCRSPHGTRLFTEHRSLGITRCTECSLIYTSPRLREPEQVYWGDYASYLAEARLVLAGRAPHHRDPNYREELELIERHRPDRGRLLDVGCNMGMLLRQARTRGWDVAGVEPSPALHRIVSEHLGLRVHNCFLEQVPHSEHGGWDVVALGDVLEHVTEPRTFLQTIARFLAPQGILYVKVPNAGWSLLKQRMLAALGRAPSQGVWDSYEHVVHYTGDTLRSMLEREGYELLEMGIARPVQVPVWHLHGGQYFQHPSPWMWDWKRHLGRSGFHALARLERHMRRGAIGSCAPNVVAVARCDRHRVSD